MAGMLKDIIDSIFSPTTKPQAGVVKAMNYSFYGLFATLFGLAFVTSWNKHVLALSAVAVALYASITWFIGELGKIEDQKKSGAEASSNASSTSNKDNDETYAEVAAEEPSNASGSGTAIRDDRQGLTERKGKNGNISETNSLSQGSTSKSSGSYASAATTSIPSSSANAEGDETYAEVAAEEPDPEDSVVREDRQGKTELKQ